MGAGNPTESGGLSSVFRLAGGKGESVQKMVEELEGYLRNLDVDVEDWKLSMKEYPDGTRIYGRFQVLIKK